MLKVKKVLAWSPLKIQDETFVWRGTYFRRFWLFWGGFHLYISLFYRHPVHYICITTYMIMALMEDMIFHSFMERLRTMQFSTTPATPMAAFRSQAFWRGWPLCGLCCDMVKLFWDEAPEPIIFIFSLCLNSFRAVRWLSVHLSLREKNRCSRMSEVEIIGLLIWKLSTFIWNCSGYIFRQPLSEL